MLTRVGRFHTWSILVLGAQTAWFYSMQVRAECSQEVMRED